MHNDSQPQQGGLLPLDNKTGRHDRTLRHDGKHLKAFQYAVCAGYCILASAAPARDIDGKYRDSPLHAWFDSLKSDRGLCCSFADGRAVDDPDVDMDGGKYRVRIDGTWYDVPDDALVSVPNKFGRAVVWPFQDAEGKLQIRCFMPGAGI